MTRARTTERSGREPPNISSDTGAPAALGRRLDGAAVEDGSRRLGVAALGESEDGMEVVDDGLEAAGGEPAAGLLVDHLPGGEVGGQVAPGGAAADEPSQGVEDVAEVVDALAGVLGEQAEARDDELPFGVRDVAGVGLVGNRTLNYVPQWTKSS